MTTFSFASTSVSRSPSPRPSVEWAIEHGFGGVEFNAPDIRLADVSPADRDYLKAMADEHQMRYTHHFPSTASPGSHEKSRRQQDRAELLTEIEVAGEIGVEVIVLHPGRLHVPGIEPEEVSEEARIESLSLLVEFMKATAPVAEETGVVIGLENMHYIPGWLICSHDELARAVDAIDSTAVGITFDVGHSWGSGGIVKGIETFGDRIRHIQVHDCRGPEGAGDVRFQHMEIGTGVLDFSVVSDLVGSKPFIVTLETSARGDDPPGAVLRSRDLLHKLWDQPPG